MDFYSLQVTAEDSKNQMKTGEYIAAITFLDCKDEAGRPDKEYYLFPVNNLETRDAFILWCKKEFGYLRYQLWFPKK